MFACLCLRPNDEQVLEMRRRGGGVMKREQSGGRSRLCVCAGLGGIQKRKHAVVPITD